MNITITCYGHSCFKVEKDGYSIILDPYKKGSVPGTELPDDLEADRVICSHQHGDHNAAERVRITSHSRPCISVSFITVPHDDAGGTKRGMNNIAVMDTGKIRIVHFGDIGRECTEEEYEQLSGAEVLMIPAGGFYTIDAETAKKIASRINPRIVILMHFRRGNAGYDVLASESEIRNSFPELSNRGHILVIDEENPEKLVCTMQF